MRQSTYHRVRGLEKGLLILRELNKIGEGSTAQIAEAARLPRTTTHRLLETLKAAGFVTRERLRDSYRLTALVRLLSDGYREDDWIVELARPYLDRLGDEVVWPTDLATYRDASMVIRASTHRRSPLSIHRAVIGNRYPMLGSAVGLAYLGFCPRAERNAILHMLRDGLPADREAIRSPVDIKRALAQTRRRGYGVRSRSKTSRTASIAVPIMAGDRVLACLDMVWIDSAMNLAKAVERHLRPLKETAARIEMEYQTRREQD